MTKIIITEKQFYNLFNPTTKEELRAFFIARINQRYVKQNIHFKIGQTTKTIEERFAAGHCKEYDGIDELFVSENKELIEYLEYELTKNFMGSKFNCDNEREGGEDMITSDSGNYTLYVVYKNYKKSKPKI